MNVNRASILAVYNAKKKLELAETPIKMYNAGRKAALVKQAEDNIGDIMRWKDKAAGVLYSRETFERNIRDIAPDKGTADRMIETYRTPIAKNERAANVFKNKLRDRVRELNISEKVLPGNQVSESTAVQFVGEHDSMIEYLTSSKRKKDDHGMSASDYEAELNDFIAANPKFDYEAVRKKATVMRGIYEDLFKRLNESRILNGYKPIEYRKGYFPHFIDETTKNENDILKTIAKQFGIDTTGDALPTTINGLTQDFKPGIKWMSSSLERKGTETTYDALNGFDRYIGPAADVIFHTGDLQRLRTLSQEIRLATSDDGIKKQAEEIRTREFATPKDAEKGIVETEDEKHEAILKLVKDGKYQLSNFVTDLDEYTNILAGKKSRLDRNMEYGVGRKFYKIMKSVESRVAANMVAVNPGSWLTNFIPLHQASALIKPQYMIRGMFDTLKAFKEGDNIESDSSFLVNRRGSDPLVMSRLAKVSQTLSMPMTYIDAFTSGTIVRARCAQNIASGMNTDTALTEADSFASSVMAGRAKGDMPTLFAARNPLTKLFTQFQLEVNNELSYMFKDLPRELKGKKVRTVAAALLKYAVGAYLFNDWYEELTGRRAAFDPLGIINNTIGDLSGYKLPNIASTAVNSVKSLTLPTADLFKTQKVGTAQAVTNLGENIAQNLPFVGGLLGGGRLPIQAAIPDVGKIATAGGNLADNKLMLPKAALTIGKELIKPAAYLLPPFGGGQTLKTAQGVAAVANGGVYTKDKDGNDQLQYPVPNGSVLDYARGALFGKSAFSGAQNWVNSGFGSETAKFTDAYKKLIAAGYDANKAYAALGVVRDAKLIPDKLTALSDLPLDINSKAEVYRQFIASDTEAVVMDKLSASGEDAGQVYSVLLDLRNAKKTEDASVTDVKKALLDNAALSDTSKVIIYRNMLASNKEVEMLDRLAQIGEDKVKSYELAYAISSADKKADKYKALLQSDVGEAAKTIAFGSFAYDTVVGLYRIAVNYGVDINTWAKYNSRLGSTIYGDSTSQDEAEKVLKLMMIPKMQKAVLWQLVNKSWKAESNPFSAQIGAAVVRAQNGGTLPALGGKTILER